MNASEIKVALNQRAPEFARYLLPNGKRRGNEWLIGNVQGDPGDSLSVCMEGQKVGVWADFATGEKGSNLIELLMASRNVDFKTALRECGELLGTALTPRHKQREAQSPANHEPSRLTQSVTDFLSGEECRRAIQMAVSLRDNTALCERIASARGWRPSTIRDLTFGPHLGWHEGKLAFIYESGVKLRWRQNGDRVIRWAFGKPWLWRGSLIDTVSTIYLCEGETDAISLIDAGVESEEESVAVALPSASTFDVRWSNLFKGKDVVLVFDADKAGQDATRRVSQLLQPHVASLKQLDWGGLQHVG